MGRSKLHLAIAVLIFGLVGCGSGQKPDEPVPATMGGLTTEPAASEAEEAPVPPSAQETCQAVCARVTECAAALNPNPPEEAEVAQFKKDCEAEVCARDDLAGEQACLDSDGASCPSLFQCLQELDTAGAEEGGA